MRGFSGASAAADENVHVVAEADVALAVLDAVRHQLTREQDGVAEDVAVHAPELPEIPSEALAQGLKQARK